MPAQRTTPAAGAAPTPADAGTTGPVPAVTPWWQQWVTPLVILGVATLFLTQQNRAFDAVNKRIDILREDLRGSETRQREDLREIREDLGRLEGKVDRLLESL